MCHQNMDASTPHRQVPTVGRQGANRGGCVYLRLTLWVYCLNLCLFWHSQTPDLVSVLTFQLVLLVSDNLIPRQDPNKKDERNLVNIPRSL